MPLEVRTCDVQVTPTELGLTRDRFTKSLLRQNLETKIGSASAWHHKTVNTPPSLQAEVDNFAEHLAAGCLTNLNTYFSRLSIAGYTAGGKRAVSRPLLYDKKHLIPSPEDIGAIGEGIAGFYLENIEKLIFDVRPFGVSPDFVFRVPGTGNRVLAEVKSSLQSARSRSLVSVAIDLLDLLAKTKFIRTGKYLGYVVQVIIHSPIDFRLTRVGMEEV